VRALATASPRCLLCRGRALRQPAISPAHESGQAEMTKLLRLLNRKASRRARGSE
jgi:hypothetical protein